MQTFANVKAALEDLERSSFAHLKEVFVPTDGIGECISGAVQFFVLDRGNTTIHQRMPIVCAVGVNYTQDRESFTGELRPMSTIEPPTIVDNTVCRAATSYVIAAYNRNSSAWTSRPTVDPLSPLEVYAASNATIRSGLSSVQPKDIEGSFILIMTNVSPFLTKAQWRVQARRTPGACEKITGDLSHLDLLYDCLGADIDLWIGHSSIHGTKWVWPHFARFVQRHNIAEWMLAGNINPQAHLAFDREYRKATHRLFPWYGPERSTDAISATNSSLKANR